MRAIMGNTAGRPLINATGRPRVVINGTCLDYLAESIENDLLTDDGEKRDYKEVFRKVRAKPALLSDEFFASEEWIREEE